MARESKYPALCEGNRVVNVTTVIHLTRFFGRVKRHDHDPATLHNVKAASLAAITVDQVLALVLPPLQTNTH